MQTEMLHWLLERITERQFLHAVNSNWEDKSEKAVGLTHLSSDRIYREIHAGTFDENAEKLLEIMK